MSTKDQRLEELDNQNMRAWMLLTEVLDGGAGAVRRDNWMNRAEALVLEMNDLYEDIEGLDE